ncbi:HAD family hydrolase [Dorea longicatena]|jgi:phosphoglycolate phosphatase|uniref:HAD family hydrolase n=2 Tax=Dorea longicatena TaxID=88431 RepID=A0A6N9JTR8_9FIRM|nr:HAD family hydrolase [Dorea sp.]MBS5435045.1 HAD family hydrolase [Dorea longicatena]NSK08405.1 HAD family hydrolase [Blautia sp. MSK.20.9]MBT9758510.1 HAD-IIIA family hydrolase [Dorea longicatena]MZK06167.1 HAD-IIIA family hydrolase [Dorea longicatena]
MIFAGGICIMKACIFDLDGTLTNTLESMTYSVNLTLKEMGLSQITKDQCRMFVGNGARVLIEESLKVSGDPKASRIEEGMKIYGRIFDQNCTYHVTLYEGIPEMLKALKDRGIHLAVLSNKPDRQTVKVVKEIFGDNIFDYAQGQKDGIRRKPEPDGVWYLMEQMQVSKEECLYIGDSEVDAATGKNAGLKTIGVLWGFRDRKTLETAGADHLIERPEELLQFV